MPKQATPATSTLFPINHEYKNIIIFASLTYIFTSPLATKISTTAMSLHRENKHPHPTCFLPSKQATWAMEWFNLVNENRNRHLFWLVWNQMVWRKKWGNTILSDDGEFPHLFVRLEPRFKWNECLFFVGIVWRSKFTYILRRKHYYLKYSSHSLYINITWTNRFYVLPVMHCVNVSCTKVSLKRVNNFKHIMFAYSRCIISKGSLSQLWINRFATSENWREDFLRWENGAKLPAKQQTAHWTSRKEIKSIQIYSHIGGLRAMEIQHGFLQQ